MLAIVRALRSGRFLYLLVALLLYLLITPYLQDFIRLRRLYDIFITVILITSIYAVNSSKIQMAIAVCLAVPMIVLLWVPGLYKNIGIQLITIAIIFFFLIHIIISLLLFIFKTDEVTQHIIFGAVCVYLLFGIAWSYLYVGLELIYPNSLSVSPNSDIGISAFYLYFSFVTMTTLGYGDITPLTPKAQSLAMVEAIVGQIYLTVLIAWLVGLYVSRKMLKS